MTSRSRLSKTRGPPDALRICPHLPRGQHSDTSVRWLSLRRTTAFARGGANGTGRGGESDCPNCLPQPYGCLTGPYTELRLVLPSKTPARPETSRSLSQARRFRKDFLRFVQSVQRVQGAHGQFGVGGVDQHRKLDFGGGDGADVDLLLRKRRKRLGCDAGM